MNSAAFSSLPADACTLGAAGAFGDDRITRNVYDNGSQLLQVQRAVGTSIQQNYATYTYTPNGQPQTVKDANGNLTSDGFTTFAYDAENRLTSASGARTATLAYDPLGRLYQMSNAAGTTRFLYDGDRLILEYNSSGAIQRRYVHGAGVDEPMVWYEGSTVSSATRRYLHADHQGSIVATSNAAGTKRDIGTYDAYGVTTAPSTWRFQYTGQTAIPQVGLYYYKARFYNPGLGRFMQTDPIGYDDDLNLYAYVGNDPLNKSDPTGLAGEDTCTGSSAGAGCELVQGSEARNKLLSRNATSGKRSGACAECDDVLGTRNRILQEARERWEEAADVAATEAGLWAVGGGLGKVFGKFARLFAARAGATVFKTGHYAERLAKRSRCFPGREGGGRANRCHASEHVYRRGGSGSL